MNKIKSLAFGVAAVLLSNGFTTISNAATQQCPTISKNDLRNLDTNSCPKGGGSFTPAGSGVALTYTRDECNQWQTTLFENLDKYSGSSPTVERGSRCEYEFKGDTRKYKDVNAVFTKENK